MIKWSCLLAVVLAAASAKPQIPISGGTISPLGSLGGFGSVTTTLPPLGVSRIGSSSISSFPLGGIQSSLPAGVKVVGIQRIPDGTSGFSEISGISGPTISGPTISGPTISGISDLSGGFGGSVISGGSVQPLGVKVLGVERISDDALGLSGASLGTRLSNADLAASGITGAGLQQLAGLGGTVTKIERISSSGVSGSDVPSDLSLSTIQQLLKKTGTQQISEGGVQQIGSPRITQVTRIGGGQSTAGPASVTITPLTSTVASTQVSTLSEGEGASAAQGLTGVYETSTTRGSITQTSQSSDLKADKQGGGTGAGAAAVGGEFGISGSRQSSSFNAQRTQTSSSSQGALQGGLQGLQGVQGVGTGGSGTGFTVTRTSTVITEGSGATSGLPGAQVGGSGSIGGQFGTSGSRQTSSFNAQRTQSSSQGSLQGNRGLQGIGTGGFTNTRTSTVITEKSGNSLGSTGGSGSIGGQFGTSGSRQTSSFNAQRTQTSSSSQGALQGGLQGLQGVQGVGTGGSRTGFTSTRTSTVITEKSGATSGVGSTLIGSSGSRQSSSFNSQRTQSSAQETTQGNRGTAGIGGTGNRSGFTSTRTSTTIVEGTKFGGSGEGNRQLGATGSRQTSSFDAQKTQSSSQESLQGVQAAQGIQGLGASGNRFGFTSTRTSTTVTQGGSGAAGSGSGTQGATSGQNTRSGSSQSLRTSTFSSKSTTTGSQGPTIGRFSFPLGATSGFIATTDTPYTGRRQQGSSFSSSFGSRTSSTTGGQTGSTFGTGSDSTGGVQRTVTRVEETYKSSSQGSGSRDTFPTTTALPSIGGIQSTRTQQSEFVRGQTTTGTIGGQPLIIGGQGAPGNLGGVQRTVTKVQESFSTTGQSQGIGSLGNQIFGTTSVPSVGGIQSTRTQQSEFVRGQTTTGTIGGQPLIIGGQGAPGNLGGVQRTVTKVQESFSTTGQSQGVGNQISGTTSVPSVGGIQSTRTQQSEFVRGQTTTGTIGGQPLIIGGQGAPGNLGGVQRTVTKVQESFSTTGQSQGVGNQISGTASVPSVGGIQSTRTQQSEFVSGQTTTGTIGGQPLIIGGQGAPGAPGTLGGVQRTVTKVQESFTTTGQGVDSLGNRITGLAGSASLPGISGVQSTRTQQSEFVSGQSTSGSIGGQGLTITGQAPGGLGGVQRTVTRVQETYKTTGQTSGDGSLGVQDSNLDALGLTRVLNAAQNQKQVTTSYSSDSSSGSGLLGGSRLTGAEGAGKSSSTSTSGFKKTTSQFSSTSGSIGSGLKSGSFSGLGNLHQSGSDGKFSILKQLQGLETDGSYQYTFETENGIQAHESGELKAGGADGKIESVTGSYSYIAPDGQRITVNYVADENGFRAVGDHIPKTPDHVLRTLEYLSQFPH